MISSRGVSIPNNTPSNQVPALTVTQVAAVEMFIVEYGDEYGRKHTTLAAKVGDKVYDLPSGETTTAQMIGFNASINKQLLEKIALMDNPSGNLPKNDKVKVL
jgi:hypothetical protein